ncbi:hypothetical protein [Crateriforma conspicua]|nr:hypothetical protein [Crateriforma conspicua]
MMFAARPGPQSGEPKQYHVALFGLLTLLACLVVALGRPAE